MGMASLVRLRFGFPRKQGNRRGFDEFSFRTILVQKGPATRIWQAGHADFYQLGVGGPYQATGGMGDTLAGMIAGFAGQFPQVSLYEE